MNTGTSEESDRKDGQVKTEEGAAAGYNRVRCVVAVMSGKGGVGKSLVTGLLASGLARAGYQVGILDADITGPSIPMLFGLLGPVEAGECGILPLRSRSGIKVMSMNLLLPGEDQPVIWRGPLISSVIKQLWGDVMWGTLDVLLVDLPPGTSDASLTIMQSLPVKGLVMVTTPQGLAALIVRKTVHMAQNVGVPISGIVENMAFFNRPDSGERYRIFGESHADEVAAAAHAPIWARLPIDPTIAEYCDDGKVEEIDLPEIQDLLVAFLQNVDMTAGLSPTGAGENAPGLSEDRPPESPGESAGEPAGQPRRNTFSPLAIQLIQSKENMGFLDQPDARGRVRGWCGDSMQIELRLGEGVIQEARFMTDGCGATIACGGMVLRLALGKIPDEALRIDPEDLLTALDGLPPDHEHCASLAVSTLRAALENGAASREK